MEISEATKLYLPSHWAKGMTPEERISTHVQFINEGTDRCRKSIQCELNIPYGKGNRQKYDIYGTDLPNDAPIFVFIHGGYWQQLSKDHSGFMAENFHKHSFKTVVIGYTLCPHTTLNEIIVEIEMAVQKVLDYAKTNKSKGLYFSGYSAGAHLISSLFSKFYPSLSEEYQCLFKAAILCCGIYDVIPITDTHLNDPLKLNKEQAKELSPMYQAVPSLHFPVYVVVGENDSPAFIQQSKLYYNKIQSCADAKFKVIENVDHFSIVEKYSDENYELFKFIIN